MNRKLASALLIASAFQAQHVLALGVGEMTMHSALNEPLKAEIKLNDVGDLDRSQVRVGLASQKQFEEARIERTFFLNDIKFVVELEPSGNGIIKLSSHKRLNEPFLDFLLEVKWPTGQVLRSYTALVDLPVYMEAAPAVVDIGTPEPVVTTKSGKPAAKTVEKSNQPEAATIKAPAKATTANSSEHAYSQVSDSQYFTERNDTLWEIALEHRGDNRASVQQVMLAIQRYNPDAFIGGNINRLKAGVKLDLPGADKIQEMNRRQAISAVDEQNREWRGAPLDASGAGTNYQAAEAAGEEGHLRLSSSGSGSANGSDEQAEGSAAGLRDKLASAQSNNEQLNDKVGSLNSQVDKLERLLELKSAELARLQQQFGEKPADSAEAKAIEQELAETAETVEQQSAALAEAKQQADNDAEQSDELTAEQEEPAEQEQEEKDVAPAVVEKQAEEPSLFAKAIKNPMYLGGLAIIILAIAALVLLRRKSKAEQDAFSEFENFDFDNIEQPESATEQDDEDDVAGEYDALNDDIDSDVDFQESPALEVEVENDELDAEQLPLAAEDALNEADVYVAYGRFEQAQTLLQKALQQNPADVALQAKLLQVFVEARDKQGFQEQYLALQAQGEQAELDNAKELLVASDETSTWLDDLPQATASASIDNSADEFDLDLPDSSDFEENAEITMIRDGIELPSADAQEDEADGFELETELDLDLDLSEDFDEPEALESTEESLDLDDDLSLDLTGIDLDEDDEPEIAADESNDDLDFSDLDLSLDDDELSLDETPVKSGDSADALGDFEVSLDFEEPAEESNEDADLSLDEEIDLGDFDLSIEEDEPSLEVASDDFELELDDSFDLSSSEEDAPASVNMAEESVAAEPSNLVDLDSDDFDFLTDADEISTKLDLAKAYVEMGDVEGARDILLEVVKEGNEQQKSEASDMLDGLE